MVHTEINSFRKEPQNNGLEIAIIGMAGRFPGAPTIDRFWQNIRNGVESISFFSNEELAAEGIDTQYLSNPKYVKAKGVLEDIEWFDASYFGYTPREAEVMDPQQRIFLECAVEALENAGYNSDVHKGLIGVYAGAGMNTYLLKNLYSNPDLLRSVGDFETMIGNDKDFLTTRVSYKLNLEGPSVAVQTACSTSLVAVCLACQSLLSGECDMVLAGGVSIPLPSKTGYLYQEGGILSADGHCRAFDARAKGTAFSGAAGIVVLKRLEDALHDKDSIYAVIKGSAINNDGSFKIGFTAPRVDGQAKAIKASQMMAEVNPSTITYIEAHGTGTPLGDPIEVAALTQVFNERTEKKGYCAIGSVKTNMGHADAAAGIAGLIKTVLMLEHKEIPPSLHYEAPNPKIDFENSPFYVNNVLKPWVVNGYPLRAGVSSFGIGGTNAHVVLEEAPQVDPTQPPRPWQLLLLSAKSAAALDSMTAELSRHLSRHPDINIEDAAYTLQRGRKVFPYRRMLVCRGREDAVAALGNPKEKRTADTFQEPVKRKPVFMFSGQGAQYVGMGATLYHEELIFREQVDRCADILNPLLGWDLRTVLYSDEEKRDFASQQLIQTSVTQLALFMVEYSLARLWMAWGVKPTAMVGHSIGEYVAACLAGVFSLTDALAMVADRGRMMQQMAKGSMLAVALSEPELDPFLSEDLSLAAVNGPALCVVSGDKEVIESLNQTLSEKGIGCRLLHTSHAFHSHMMTPVIKNFAERVKTVRLNPPNIPFISNVTGNWIKPEEATDPNYWARHLRQTVRFADGMQKLSAEADRVFLEVGPGNTLCTFARQYLEKDAKKLVFSSLPHPKEQKSDMAVILDTVGRLWMAGIHLDWPAYYADRNRSRIPLPSYPFERKRHWVETQKVRAQIENDASSSKKIPDPMQWLYIPSWKKSEKSQLPRPDQENAYSRWLLFMDEKGLGHKLLDIIRESGNEASTAFLGKKFVQISGNEFEVNPSEQKDYLKLFRKLKALNAYPDVVVHLWSFDDYNQQSGQEYFGQMQTLGYHSLVYLCKAHQDQNAAEPISIQVIGNGICKISESDQLIPEKSTILGPSKVINQEFPNIVCRFMDVGLEESLKSSAENLAAQLFPEIIAMSPDPMVAYRDGQRWLPKFERLSNLEEIRKNIDILPDIIKDDGVYLITGGLGNVGLVIAEYLANSAKVKLIFTGRSDFPDQDEWREWLNTHDEKDRRTTKIQKLLALKEKGTDLLIIKADVSKENEMKAALEKIDYEYGELNGVIHAAGFVDTAELRFVNELNNNDSEKHFLPKVYGLYVLQKVLVGRQLDFCHVVSSVASILGGLGYSAYAAANIFMDSFVDKYRQSESIPWMSVNWDAWRFDQANINGLGGAIVQQGITPKEGHILLSAILGQLDQSRIIVSTTALDNRINQWVNLESLQRDSAKADNSASVVPINLSSNSAVKAPSTDNTVEEKLIAIWQDLIGIDDIDINDNFFELGGSSLTALRLFTEIENIFGKKISLATLLKASTINQLSKIVKQDDTSSSWNSLVKFHDNGSNAPIFLVHGAEGNILLYRELANHLGPDQPVYGLQSQGLDGGEIEYTRIEEIATFYIDQIRSKQPEGPYFLGGYCMGGVVSFEMAQQLIKHGERVNLCALFETYNPQLDVSPESFFQKLYYSLQNLSFHIQNFINLNLKDKFKFVRKKTSVEFGRIKGGIIAGVSTIISSLTFKKNQKHSARSIKKIHDRAYYNYKPQYYPGRLTLFRPQKFFSGVDDPHFGWKELVNSNLDVFELSVKPRGMLFEPYVKELAETLKLCISKSTDNSTGHRLNQHR